MRELPEGEDVGTRELIESQTLQRALESTHLAERNIDYLNIDCEGRDFQVLSQMDFKSCSVSIITIEALDQESQDQICHHLEQRGYRLREKIHWTLLFTRSDSASHLTSLTTEDEMRLPGIE